MLRASIPATDAGSRRELLETFVDAAIGDDAARADAARTAVIDRVGPAWLVDAAAVLANFEMMTRLADGTGARLIPQRMEAAADLRAELGLDEFTSSRLDG